jgi:hypothetical protein
MAAQSQTHEQQQPQQSGESPRAPQGSHEADPPRPARGDRPGDWSGERPGERPFGDWASI